MPWRADPALSDGSQVLLAQCDLAISAWRKLCRRGCLSGDRRPRAEGDAKKSQSRHRRRDGYHKL